MTGKAWLNGTGTAALKAGLSVAAAAVTAWIFVDTALGSLEVRLTNEIKEIAKVDLAQSTEIAVIKANRFTSANGLEVWRAISDVKEQIASLPTEVPPAWFVGRVDQIEARLERIDARLQQIERSIE